MRRMTNNPIVPVRMTDEIKSVLTAYAKKRKLTLSALLRDAALREAGREDLIEAIQMGRPKNEEPPQ